MKRSLRVVVTGSLGNVGLPLTKNLVSRGHKVTVISSKSDKKLEIEGLGATAAVGSVEDVAFLSSAFKDQDVAYLMIPPKWDEVDGVAYYARITTNYSQAIQASHVKRVVHLSSWGVHEPGVMDVAKKSEEILNKLPSDIAVTHLRATSFYTNLYSTIPQIKAQGFFVNNYGGSDVQVLVHPRDIADVAKEEIEAENAAAGNNYRYVSSDEVTCDEVAKALGQAIGKPDLQWKYLSDEEYKQALAKAHMPPHVQDRLAQIGKSVHNGTIREHYLKNKPKQLGQVKLAEFAMEFAGAYNAPSKH